MTHPSVRHHTNGSVDCDGAHRNRVFGAQSQRLPRVPTRAAAVLASRSLLALSPDEPHLHVRIPHLHAHINCEAWIPTTTRQPLLPVPSARDLMGRARAPPPLPWPCSGAAIGPGPPPRAGLASACSSDAAASPPARSPPALITLTPPAVSSCGPLTLPSSSSGTRCSG